MAKARAIFLCEECGNESLKWQGQCPQCNAWNSLTPMTVTKAAPSRAALAPTSAGAKSLVEVMGTDEPRVLTGIHELDRVLGGGLVAGSVTLLGGDPGIGKSTLLLQAADALS